MTQWRRVGLNVALSIHSRQLANHGGGEGICDTGLLESALARPQTLVDCGNLSPDVADLVASCAFGIARNRPFVDGNKRTAYVVSLLFLLDNGYRLTATDFDKVSTFLSLASGTLNEADLAAWFRSRIRL
ncbi:type II toxin-antitoxin system death-on-curing family toxin [Azospirillum argentinense]